MCITIFPFLEEFKHFDDHVHQLYTKSSYLVDDESWPPFTPNKFINLLFIRHLSTKCFPSNRKACHSKNIEESFTTKNISELFQHGKKVEPHNKIVLIRGVPGIGKTILSKEIAYQWADNKLLSETEIVLMLFMRDPGIKKITELKYLVHYFYGFSKDTEDISAECAKRMLQLRGINVTIILDGLDEIPAEVIDSTYIRLLLDRKALPCCRIVVTSRPAVSITFQSKVDIEAEILGFTDENINIFIQNELKKDKQIKLTNYLKQNKTLYHLCYIPFILSVLVCVAKECDELPSNRVEVYKKFVVYTISRFLKRFEHSDHAISTIDELPKTYKSYLFELSKYAFNALEIDQVVFTRKDITKDFFKLANAPENWYGLGLLNSVKYFKIAENSDCISYNFLHKSIQEFLAALYVTTLSEAEQFIIIKKSFFQEKYLNMWIMYIGLNKNLFSFWYFLSGKRLHIWSKWFGTTAISPKILQSKTQCLYLFHCFSELRNKSMCNLVGTLFQLGKLDLSYCTLSLNEINTIIFMLEGSPTTYWSELNLSHCYIGDAGCQHLCKGLSKLNHKVYFDKIDIDDNKLSLESLQHLVMLLVQCKTQKLYATNNIITMDNSKIAYLVMEYAFAVKAISNPLSIIVNSQERAIFCQSENNAIIKYLNSTQMISGLYYNNCHLNDEVIGLVTDLIRNYEMITDLYFWNSNISEDYLKRILSVMPQGNHYQFMFVYEALEDDKSIVEMILSSFVSFTFIFLSKASLILFNASYSHITHLIFANPMLPETTLIETICLSQCELSDETIKLLIQLFNLCNNISTLILLNNTFSSGNLKQLMYAIKSKHILRTIFVCHNTMTHHDINSLEDEFKNIQMLLINDKILKGYNYCDKQLKHASQLQIFPSLTAHVLQLHYCDIKDNALTYLYKLFQHCDHLTEITIFYCLVDIHTINELIQQISTIITLRKLNLRGNKLIKRNTQALASVIANNNELEELYLGTNNLQSGVISIAKALKKLSSLKVLDLGNNNVPEEAGDELAAAIKANSSLEKLWLGGNHLGSSTVMIVNALMQVTTLKELNLNNNQNRSEELASALKSIILGNKSMQSLLLNDNNFNDGGIAKIAQSLCKHTKLKMINLRSNNITEKAAEALASIISSNTGLEQLYLGNNTIQLGVIKLAKALKKLSSLKVLDLGNNNVPEEAGDELAAAIKSNSSLEKLWLFGNHLGSSTVMIVNALKQITTLNVLDLNSNQNRSEELAPALTSIISTNGPMENLSLSNNNLNDDGVIKIAQSLCKHTKLKVINLQSNNITEKAAEALASIISSNTGLEQLYLDNNTIQLGVITISTALTNISLLKVLDLDNNNIHEEAADELSAAIRANNSLEKLCLGGNRLGSSTVMIVNALKQITTLKELNLNGNQNRSEELAPALTSIISVNKSIENLLLSDNNLNDDGVIKIAQSLCKHTKLKVINLRSNNITEKAAEALASIISSNARLEKLYLGYNTIQLGVITMSTALTNISSLKVLDLDNNNIPEEAADELSAAIRANNSLKKLCLGSNHLRSSTVMIVNALMQVTTLKKLSLTGNQNRNKELAPALTSLLSHNKSMESLLLRDNNLNDDGILKIAQSLCRHTKLKIINLRSNNITEKAAEALGSIISSNTGLEQLYLGNNTIQLGVIKLAKALKKLSSLKVLDLDNNNIPEEAADELSAAIRANSSLEKLWLFGNRLGSSTVLIANALKQVTTLKELNLNGNQNRSEELAPALTSIISHNNSMENLLLRDNNLNDDGILKIAQSLCKHTKLKMINLQSNNITEKSAEALASIISSNTGLEELYLGNNTMQLGVITISTALKSISSLKVLNLDHNNIPEEAAAELSDTIKANNLIEKLWLNNNNLSSMSVIAEACCHISSLKDFSFKNIGISVTATNDIATVIRHNSSIQLLSMSDNNLQSSGFMVIAQALKVTSSLKLLYAYGINVTSTVTEELSSVIKQNLSMEELSLGDNLLENGLMQIVESCSRLTSLKVLELSHNCISPTQVVNFASTVSKCNSLEALSVGGICLSVDENLYLNISTIYEMHVFVTDIKNTINNEKQLCNYRFYIFSELLRMIFCRALLLNHQHLNVMYQYDFIYISYQHKNKFYENKIYYNLFLQEAKQKLSQIDSKAMLSSLRVIRTLKVINLESNNIDEDAATELAGHLHSNNILEQLWLRGNELYDKGASIVLQSLHNFSTLLILDLSYNHLSSESADGIAVVVGNNCSLQQLWLDGNELLTRGVVRIASALKKLSSLRILSLCSNGITDDAAEEISNVITNNTLLVDLLLGNNQLESKGVCTIAMAKRKLFDLRKLDLSNNHITPDAAEELAITLSNCANLKQLFLNDNMLGNEGTIKIANALKCINTLQVLTLSNNNITESAADVLVDVLRNNISLKILLISENDLQTTGVNLIAQTAAKNIITLQLLDVSNNNIVEGEKEYQNDFCQL